MTGGGSGPFYGIRPKDNSVPIKYLLAILNSALFGWIVKSQSTNLRGGYIKFSKQYIESVPIVMPEMPQRDRVVTLVERMLTLHKQLPQATTEHERKLLQRQITSTDEQIDQLVYALYGLTPEEIAIVEGAE
jgi:adenine-specific DNA-methyltransferase